MSARQSVQNRHPTVDGRSTKIQHFHSSSPSLLAGGQARSTMAGTITSPRVSPPAVQTHLVSQQLTRSIFKSQFSSPALQVIQRTTLIGSQKTLPSPSVGLRQPSTTGLRPSAKR